MRSIGIPQHLHAITAVFRYNDVPGGIEGHAPRFIEQPVPCSLAVNRAQVRQVAVPQHLHAMVVKFSYDQVTLWVKRHAAVRTIKLPVASTYAADCAHEACAGSCNRAHACNGRCATNSRSAYNPPQQPAAACSCLQLQQQQPQTATL